jgi:spoIIIJ-associated protein
MTSELPTSEAIADEDEASASIEDAADEPSPVAPAEPFEPDDIQALDSGTGERPADDDATLLEREGDIAADYLEVLLDIADLDGDIDIDVEGDRAAVSVVGPGLDRLIGTNGATLDALQELTRLAVHRETGVRSRLMLDVGGHRAQRREDLTALGTAAAQRVAASGEVERLAPMTPFERKIVHDAVATVDGVDTESEGEEPDRCVVIRPV